jgi:flagellar basal-body rod protein FlgG
MIDALFIAASGLRTEQTQIDVISNNVANINTPGFKKSGVSFADVAYHDGVVDNTKPTDAKPEHMVGGGTQITSTRAEFSPGDMQVTNNQLDVAINGDGFIEVTDAQGNTLYTRAGALSTDSNGYLQTVTGQKLTANIQIPVDSTKVIINSAGAVQVQVKGQTQLTTVGQLQLARFMNPQGLLPMGSNAYQATQESGQPVYSKPGDSGMGTLQQGYVEQSNVDMAEEMTNLVVAQRAYQLNARIIQAADEVLDTINNLRR